MKLIPAIDILDKKVVRLTRGKYSDVQVFSDDPIAIAKGFEAAGATEMHLVDLDGARLGEMTNFDIIKKITEKVNIKIEVGGGIRDKRKAEDYLSLGIQRIILGTSAVEDSAFLDEMLALYSDRVAVGVDAIGGKVATRGWETVTELDGVEFVRTLAERGAKYVVFTDIARDGAMQGANLPLYEKLAKIKGLSVIASGGVSSYEDIKALAALDIYGAIVGKALYLGSVDLKNGIEIAEGVVC